MKIVGVRTYLVGNPWKNWLFVRVDTDEGIHGVGEGTLNAFSGTVGEAIRELEAEYLGADPFRVEALLRRMVRDVYTDGGQVHLSAVAAIEVACWDIIGKALGRPVHDLLGGRIRDRVRLYANGWYRVNRTPEAFADAARRTVALGYTALKLDPFGAGWRVLERREEDLSIDIVAAVREAVGTDVDVMVEGHCRFSPAAALRLAERLAEHRPAWFEEPVPHQNVAAMVSVAMRSPVPIATGESFTSLQQFADLMRHDVVSIYQPEPLYLGGLWRARAVAQLAEAHYAVVAPHNAQGPVCSAISRTLGACVPNFYVQEAFDETNDAWTRQIVDRPLVQRDGYVEIMDEPGLGIELDWERLERHPYERAHLLRLWDVGWERRGARMEDDTPS